MKTGSANITMPRTMIIVLMLMAGTVSLVGAGAAMPPLQPPVVTA